MKLLSSLVLLGAVHYGHAAGKNAGTKLPLHLPRPAVQSAPQTQDHRVHTASGQAGEIEGPLRPAGQAPDY